MADLGSRVAVVLVAGTALDPSADGSPGCDRTARAAQLLVLVGLLAAELLAVGSITDLIAPGAATDSTPSRVVQESHRGPQR
ncbi:hypothetical protein [Blastococcus brunescens]|uniref:Uncharacterized protein n=1 Tax=Blastococcus brunescens TaxID=1564165 RepID=A0ABZ1B424_9ACTN|nr:hypothetical protein [Blastococcus sp. BMG 8361]WRL64568.1 hypothetical protein U6N30_01795 [Blastococcus sp. BMG 8361]